MLVEDSGPSGVALIQELRTATSYPVIGVKVDRDKISRASAILPMFEAGRVWLPADAPWLTDFVDELCVFPHGVHDDQVDAMTQALNYLREGPYTEPVPFERVEREGPLAWIRNVIARPSTRIQDPQGFPEARAVLPLIPHDLSPEAAKAATLIATGQHPDGRPATSAESEAALERFMWSSIKDFSGEDD